MTRSVLYRNIATTIKWNALESLLYSSAMLIHQTVLFYTMDKSLYGTAGAFFSFIFLSEHVLCFGLNEMIGTFLDVWSSNKKNFRNFFGYNIIVNYGMMIPYMFFFLYIASHSKHYSNLSTTLCILIGTIIFLEKTKRVCKTVLHIIFHSKIKAFVELSTFFLYLAIVWASYSLGTELTPITLLFPMLIMSLLSCVALLTAVIHYAYSPLPPTEFLQMTPPLWWRIFKERLLVFYYTTSKRSLSANFMVPAFAATFGMHHAALIKYVKQVAYYVTFVLKKTFGNASTVLFAHTRCYQGGYTHNHFSLITRFLLYSMLFIISISFITMCCLYIFSPNTLTFSLTALIIISFFHAIISHGVTTIEHWFVINERSFIPVIIQTFVTILWGFILFYAHELQPLTLIIAGAICNTILFVSLLACILLEKIYSRFSYNK